MLDRQGHDSGHDDQPDTFRLMEIIPITEAEARVAELADRVAREHDHFTITRNGRADVMLISVAEYESMRETLEILSDGDTLADLRRSREDFGSGETFDVDQVRAELENAVVE
ncbi:type II toxin-antitoxin system Phd/YefM family antitoxin [Nocardia arizonensis]|uniref:type II toxin-antitoxin system Phd/YefM family antitoxin n=1 Tax=Nocardia arizonensis TaxID=1141647 RepID=UPI000A3F7BA2|nr:type II toxin-antitoxin system Phd/YefM family antitoxin [Nocardia arizonensis]